MLRFTAFAANRPSGALIACGGRRDLALSAASRARSAALGIAEENVMQPRPGAPPG